MGREPRSISSVTTRSTPTAWSSGSKSRAAKRAKTQKRAKRGRVGLPVPVLGHVLNDQHWSRGRRHRRGRELPEASVWSQRDRVAGTPREHDGSGTTGGSAGVPSSRSSLKVKVIQSSCPG